MQITLSTTPASESWGKNAILSFNQDQAVIHLKDDEKSNLVLVQKAARKLRGQGIKDVELVGEAWELENCWAFYQGFYSAKQDYSIEFPHLDDEPQDELLARIECGDFVRGCGSEHHLCFFAGQLGWPDFLRVELCADDFGHLAQPLPEYQQAVSGEQTLLLDAGSGEGSQKPLFSLPPLSPDRPGSPGQGQDYDYLPQVQGKIPAKNLTA